MAQAILFTEEIRVQDESIEVKIERAVQAILTLFVLGHPACIAFSGGKDSGCVLTLALMAAVKAKGMGFSPCVMVMTSDTRVENPEVSILARRELAKAEKFGRRHGLNLTTHIAKPSIAASWVCRILSARSLPSFPETNHDCAVDFKVLPMARLRKNILSTATAGKEPTTLVGTRFSESATRNRRMQKRGETAEIPYRNVDGDLVMSPIAYWSTDEVWETIAMASAGVIDGYTDFKDCFELYAGAGGTSCAVVSDAITEGMKHARGGCGARTGCWCCVAVAQDTSLTTMIEGDPKRYGYMAGLNRLRNFIAATQWDLSRRNWIGRTIIDGHIKIGPDNYSPSMCVELLRYCLTLDAEERRAAARLGIRPRFEIVSLEELVALDALWSLQSFCRPFTAVKEYIDITENGMRYRIPEMTPFPRCQIPTPAWLYVGENWNQGLPLEAGLRDFMLELVNENGMNGCMGTRTLSDGRTVLDVETASEFSVDLEGACLSMDFEEEFMLRTWAESDGKTYLTEGYHWWLRMGVVALTPNQVGIHDSILARSYFKERHGLAGEITDLDALIKRCVPSVGTQSPLF